ncbi:MAG: hypothetical protein GXO07_06045 [Crenarchaeota archaeon]|nr:hypothetical protein [Thermoproteota archaeon]
MRIKLMPPFLLGRYFQALALYLSNVKVLEYGPDYVEVDEESFEVAMEDLIEKMKAHIAKTGLEMPLYGNDYKYFIKNYVAKEIEDLLKKENELKERRKRARGEKAKELAEELSKVLGEKWERIVKWYLKGGRGSRLLLFKATVHKYPKDFLGKGKDAEAKDVEDPKGEALAVIGATLSVLGRVDENVIFFIPPLPESLRENKSFVRHLRARHEAMVDANITRYPFDKAPCSAEVLLQFAFAYAFATHKSVAERLDCMNPFDNVFVASVKGGGNRPLVNSIIPLMASEIVCKLKSGELLGTLLAQLRHEPDAAGACVNDLFQYVLSGNYEHLYRCARRWSGLLISGEDIKKAVAKKIVAQLTEVVQ